MSGPHSEPKSCHCVKGVGVAIQVANHILKASKRWESKEVGVIQIPYHLSLVYEMSPGPDWKAYEGPVIIR